MIEKRVQIGAGSGTSAALCGDQRFPEDVFALEMTFLLSGFFDGRAEAAEYSLDWSISLRTRRSHYRVEGEIEGSRFPSPAGK